MDKKICINRFFKNDSIKDKVDLYINYYYSNKKFRHNNKTRLWHIRNIPALKRYIEHKGVRI